MPFKKILAPADEHVSSDVSMGVAATLAKAMGCPVTVVHVIPASGLPTGMETGATREFATVPDYGSISVPVEDGNVEGSIISAWDQRAESVISGAKSIFADYGLEIRTDIMRFREPAEAILELADEGWYDLIVMAKGGDDEWDLPKVGEVAMNVAREFPRSALVVKKACGLKNISVLLYPGDDGGPVELAFELAETFGSHLNFMALEDEEDKGGGDAALRPILQRASDSGVQASGAIIARDWVQEIERNLKDTGADTLLVRRPKVGAIGRFLHRCEWVYDLLETCPSSVLLAA